MPQAHQWAHHPGRGRVQFSPTAPFSYLKADAGIQGEGERAFVQVLERLKKEKDLSGLSGVYLPETGLQGPVARVSDLDDLPLPLPDSRLFMTEKIDKQEIWLPFQARRGCPMGCSYCSATVVTDVFPLP